MQKSLRLKKIKAYISEKKDVQIIELKSFLDVSESTIRRDIKDLSQEGFLKELHGSVVINEKKYSDTEFLDRLEIHVDVKQRIAQKAAMHIENHDLIYLDAGTTTFYVPRYIQAKHVQIVTNGIDNAIEAAQYGFETILIGGEFKLKTRAIIGEKALEELERYQFDHAIMGANGFDEESYSTPDYKEGVIKKKAMRQARNSMVLVDASKKAIKTHYSFAKRDEAKLITGDDAS